MTNEEGATIINSPSDLYELYMVTRAEISMGLSFYQLYLKLLCLIDIGRSMLNSETHDKLIKSAEETLTNVDNYPSSGQIEIEGDLYRVGPQDGTTGLIHVKQEDLAVGLEESKNQQAQKLLPLLKKMDSEIFRALVDSGIIEIRNFTISDMLKESLMQGLADEEEGEEKK